MTPGLKATISFFGLLLLTNFNLNRNSIHHDFYKVELKKNPSMNVGPKCDESEELGICLIRSIVIGIIVAYFLLPHYCPPSRN